VGTKHKLAVSVIIVVICASHYASAVFITFLYTVMHMHDIIMCNCSKSDFRE